MSQEPLILAVETSSRTGSAALALGEKILAESSFSGPAKHSIELFPSIRQLLNQFGRKIKEIEHIYISIGPGSFTGLRIAATLAKMMQLAIGAKIVTVDTLDCIAANVTDNSKLKIQNSKLRIATILDAKRNQFFIAVYEYNPCLELESPAQNTWKKIFPDTLMTAEQFIERFAGCLILNETILRPGSEPALSLSKERLWLLGDGLLYHKDKFKADFVRFLDQKYWSPRAGKVHFLGWQKALAGQFTDAISLMPNYLCRPDAEYVYDQRKTYNTDNTDIHGIKH